MATKEKEIRLEKVLQDMSFALNHIEDMMADNRALIVKVIKQGNSVVQFLAKIDIETIEPEIEEMTFPTTEEEDKFPDSKRIIQIKELVDEFMKKRTDLKELEEELKKYKDEIIPGQIGES